MVNIQISEETARKIYPNASFEFKKVLEESCRPGFFSTNIIDRVKNMDDVFTELGLNKETFYKECAGLSDDEKAYREVKLIALCLNEGWAPDWEDGNQRKWRPWFYMGGAGGFRFDASGFDGDGSNVGSRLCFKNEALSDYAAKTFIDVYKRFFTA